LLPAGTQRQSHRLPVQRAKQNITATHFHDLTIQKRCAKRALKFAAGRSEFVSSSKAMMTEQFQNQQVSKIRNGGRKLNMRLPPIPQSSRFNVPLEQK
jgi:hypothetical protein